MKNPETKIARQIAKTVLGIESLEVRNSDSLDFHDLSVSQIKEALEKAYIVGRTAGRMGE